MLSRAGIFAWHRRLGAALGLLLFVVCSSGTLAVLGFELDEWLGPAYPVETVERVPWEQVDETLAREFPYDRPTTVMFEPGEPLRVALESPLGQSLVAVLDPVTGELLDTRHVISIQVFLRQFHKGLLIPKGLYIVTLMSVLLFFSLLSGAIVYRRFWKYLFRLRLRKGSRVAWADIHRTVGVWSIPFAILIAVTGTWYFVEALGRDTATYQAEPPAPSVSGTQVEATSLSKLVDSAESALPDLRVRTILLPGDHDSLAVVHGQRDAILVRPRVNRVYLGPRAEVVEVWREEEQAIDHRLSDMADPLHFGSFGGLPVKLLWFVFGVLLSTVVLAGPLLGFLRGQKRVQQEKFPLPGLGRRIGSNVPNVLVALLVVTSMFLTNAATSFPLVAGWAPPATAAPIEAFDSEMLLLRHDEEEGGRATYRLTGLGRPVPHEATLRIEDVEHTLHHGELFADRSDEVTLTIDGEPQTVSLRPTEDLPAPLQAALTPRGLSTPGYVTAFVVGFFVFQLLIILTWLWLIGRPWRGSKLRGATRTDLKEKSSDGQSAELQGSEVPASVPQSEARTPELVAEFAGPRQKPSIS